MAEVMPPVVQGQVVGQPQSQKVYPGQPGQVAVPVRGNAAARRQYMAARRGGDGSGRLRQVHYLIAFGIAVPIIVLIVLLAVLLPREESGGKSSDDSGQSRHNAPGYCAASTSAEINQRVRPVWRYYLLFWPPRRSARVLGVLAGGVLGLLTRTFDFAQASATQCLPLWTDNTINGCSTHQEYCTNCDDSFHWCCTTNNCEGENDGWCRCNAGAPTKQPASGECLTVNRTCMASWTDATFPGCAATQNACSADASGNACDHTASSPSTIPWCCLDQECEGEGSGWCWCKP